MKWSKFKELVEAQISAKGWVDPELYWIDWSEDGSSESLQVLGNESDASIT
jgi:hypothetical protein